MLLVALVRGAAGRDRLVPMTLRVDTVRDEVLDEDGPATGKQVSAATGGEIVVLLADIPGLRAGPVTTLATDPDIAPTEIVRLALRRSTYALSLECGAPERGMGTEQAACAGFSSPHCRFTNLIKLMGPLAARSRQATRRRVFWALAVAATALRAEFAY